MLYLPREVRDGDRILRFDGIALGAVTSARPNSPRWAELAVYGLPGGLEYIFTRVGRSTVAHRETCMRVSHRMPRYLEAREEGRVRRVPCEECRPPVGDEMDPMTRLEQNIHRAFHAHTAEILVQLIRRGRDPLPWLDKELLRQCSMMDEQVALVWDPETQKAPVPR